MSTTPGEHRPRPLRQGPTVRRGLAGLGCLALLVLTGCRAEVVTTIAPDGADLDTVKVTAVFTDEAAEVIASDAESRAGLRELFESRSGERPEITITADRVEASATVAVDEVSELAEVTGIEAVTVSRDGDLVEVAFTQPTQLVDTITNQNAGDDDAEALTSTMLANTHLIARVELGSVSETAVLRSTSGGEQDAVQGPGAGEGSATIEGVGDLVVQDSTATLDRTADQDSSGVLVVEGEAASTPWLLFIGGGLLAAAGVVVALRRRH